MFMKNPDAVIGPGDTITLPKFTVPWIFMHEAELALVIKGPAKMVKAKDWKNAIFGYTTMIDVSAREQGRRTWPATPLTSWLGKSFDTFAPIGPCIAIVDEIKNPNDLIVHFWNDGQLRHNYSTDDMEHRVPELVEFATTVMTMNSGVAGWGRSTISTMPGETLPRVAPNVVINPCLAKLDRTRSCCSSGVILLVPRNSNQDTLGSKSRTFPENVGLHERPLSRDPDVRFGSWPCQNALPGGFGILAR